MSREEEVRKEIASLQEKLSEIEKEKDPERWPKTVLLYAHADSDSNWEKGEELGLSEEAIAGSFKYALMEVEFEIELNQDGTYRILSYKDL